MKILSIRVVLSSIATFDLKLEQDMKTSFLHYIKQPNNFTIQEILCV